MMNPMEALERALGEQPGGPTAAPAPPNIEGHQTRPAPDIEGHQTRPAPDIEVEWQAYADELRSSDDEEDVGKGDDEPSDHEDGDRGKGVARGAAGGAIAEAVRAGVRKHLAERGPAEDGAVVAISVEEILDMVGSDAEEDAQPPAMTEGERFWADSGVPVVPFNLDDERAEGGFNDFGEYKEDGDGEEDAWLDCLGNEELDPEWVRRVTTRGRGEEATGPSSPGDGGDERRRGELARRVAGALLPGETPLAALKRLGGRRHRKGEAVGRREQQRWVPVGSRAAFDGLTADVSQLVDLSGDPGWYMRTREQYVGGGSASHGSPPHGPSGPRDDVDMFS